MYKHLSLIIVLLTLTPLFAQDRSTDELVKELTSPRWIIYQEAQERPSYDALWNGGADWISARIMLSQGGEAEFGLTEEQDARLSFLRKENEIAQELFRRKFQQQDPELLKANELANAAILKDDPYFYNATDEQKRAYMEANMGLFQFADKYMDQELRETLTPEQMVKVQTLKLQLLPGMGLPSPAMFEPLGLSDEQKAEMETIKSEMKAEFDSLVDEQMGMRREFLSTITAELVEKLKNEDMDSPNRLFDELSTIGKKTMEDFSKDENQIKMRKATDERGRKFATLLKARLMNVLTDEQLDKMQKLMDDSPDFVKKMLAKMSTEREEAEKSNQWSPGPNSWRPGDGTPEDFKNERKKGNFPKAKIG